MDGPLYLRKTFWIFFRLKPKRDEFAKNKQNHMVEAIAENSTFLDFYLF